MELFHFHIAYCWVIQARAVPRWTTDSMNLALKMSDGDIAPFDASKIRFLVKCNAMHSIDWHMNECLCQFWCRPETFLETNHLCGASRDMCTRKLWMRFMCLPDYFTLKLPVYDTFLCLLNLCHAFSRLFLRQDNGKSFLSFLVKLHNTPIFMHPEFVRRVELRLLLFHSKPISTWN